MTVINADMDASVNWIPLANPRSLVPGFYSLGSENLRANGLHFSEPARPWASTPNGVWCKRGIAGSTAASHSSGATITRYYPDAAGSGGGSISVTDGVTTVDPATSVTFPAGTVTDAGSGGAAVGPAGFLLAGLLTASGDIPPTGNFYAIPVANTYDPDGYYSANLPNGGVPGFLVPAVGDGKLHRVTLALTVGDLSAPEVGMDEIYVMAAISPTVTVDAGDIRVFDTALQYGPSNGEGVGLSASWVGILAEDDEVYVYAKQQSVDNAEIRVGYVSIERLA